ncbi:MAG: DUF481 domain-containing protein [Planctomycetota bacterium]|jgi:putative salt-induced outer membrane protein YdiY
MMFEAVEGKKLCLAGLLAGAMVGAAGADEVLDPSLGAVTPTPVTEALAGDVPELVDDVSLAAFQEEEEDTKDGTWRSRFTLAAAGSFGNTDTQAINLGVSASREDEDDRTTFESRWFWGATDGDETENRFIAGLRQDWFIPDSKWFFFGQARYDYDSYQSWDQRFGAHGGVGYKWIEKDNYTNHLRVGAGFTKEWGSEDQDLKPEGLLGTDITWQITDKQKITVSSTLFPDFGDFGEYRWVTVADWSVLVDEQANMSISAGLYNEYNSEVDPDVKHNDLKVYAGLTFDF